MATPSDSFDVPYGSPPTDKSGTLSAAWQGFFRTLYDRLQPLGGEKSFQLANNQATPTLIDGMKVNARAVSHGIVEYLIQRVTTDTGAVELIEAGMFTLVYRPTDNDWDMVILSEELPDDAGIEFSIDADGQVFYTSTDVTGTPNISRIVWRMRTLAAKSALYSSQGARL